MNKKKNISRSVFSLNVIKRSLDKELFNNLSLVLKKGVSKNG